MPAPSKVSRPSAAANRASLAMMHAAEREAEGDPPAAAHSAAPLQNLPARPRPNFEPESVVINPAHSIRNRKTSPNYIENPDQRRLKGGYLKRGTKLEDISVFSTHAQWLLHGIPFSDLISQQPPITNHAKIMKILKENPWCWDFVAAEDNVPGAIPFESLQPSTLTEPQSGSLYRMCQHIHGDWEKQVNSSKLPMEQQPYEPPVWVCDAAFLWNKSRSICALCNEEMVLITDYGRYPKANPDGKRTPCPNKVTLERKWRQILHVPSNMSACIHHRCQPLTQLARLGTPPTPTRLGGPVAYWADAIKSDVIQAQDPSEITISIALVVQRAKTRMKQEGHNACTRLPGANGKRAGFPRCLCPWHIRFNAIQEEIASEFGQDLKDLNRAHTTKYWHKGKRPRSSSGSDEDSDEDEDDSDEDEDEAGDALSSSDS